MLRALVALACVLVLAAPAHAESVRVARAALLGGESPGLVFFLPATGRVGAVAVGAAHSFDLTQLAEVGEVRFRGAGNAFVAASHRLFARPGRAYKSPGATPRDDFVVFALGAAPRGVRLLAPGDAPAVGAKVEIVGLADRAAAETVLTGTVAKALPTALEISLAPNVALRGFGGAPVVLAGTDTVVGILQGSRPGADHTTAVAGPIGGAVDAMREPFEEGLGRLFATLAPPPSAANSPSLRRRAPVGTPLAERSPEEVTARVAQALARAAPPPRKNEPLRVTIESPEPEAIFGDAAGAFLAGRALAEGSSESGGAVGPRYDVFLVIDTSLSTQSASGADVDGDGEVGVDRELDRWSSDREDSILAAEVAAAHRLLVGLDPKRTRVGIVSFSGDRMTDSLRPPIRRAAVVIQPLTADYRRVRAALDELAKSDPLGDTHMAAGIDLALLELLGVPGAMSTAEPDSRKLVLLFTDGSPTLPFPVRDLLNDHAVLSAADRARRAGVRIDSFAIGPAALERPFSTLEAASVTGGIFTPVPDPARLTEFVEATSAAEVESVAVRNTSNGADAHEVRLHADGSWEALVPLAVGKNRIAALARARGGAEAAAEILVHYAPGSAPRLLPAELVERHNRLLQSRLLTLTVEQRERTRKELILEIETARRAALEQAEITRKQLELRAEPLPDAP
jgi:hypothetical protein